MKKTYLLTRNRIATIFLAVFCSMTGIAASAQICFPSWNYTTANPLRFARGFDIARDSDGSIYVCGTFENLADFPSSCTITAIDGGLTPAAFIAKFNSCGDLLWLNYDFASGWSEGTTLAVDTDGTSVFLAGHSMYDQCFFSSGTTPCGTPVPAPGFLSSCYYVARFNKGTGAFLDAHTPAVTPGYSNYRISSLAINKDASGNYELYLTGIVRNTPANATQVLLSRSDFGGTYSTTWTKFSLNTSGTTARGWDIIYNPVQSDLSVTGDYQKQLFFSAVSGPPLSVGTSAVLDGFICTFDPATGDAYSSMFRTTGAAGNQRASGKALAVDASGDVYYSGMYTGNLASTYGFVPMAGTASRMRSYAMRTSGTTLVWVNNISTTAGGDNEAYGITFNSTDCFISGVFFNGNLSFPAGTNTYVSGAAGELRAFIGTFDRGTGLNTSGNVTESMTVGSQHQARRIIADNSFAYTTGFYSGYLDYGSGTPTSGPLTSVPFGYDNMMVLRNSAALTNPYAKPSGNGNDVPVGEVSATDIFSIYPNPATDAMTIRLGEDLELPARLVVSDAQGRVVTSRALQSHTVTVDVTRFAAGIYTLTVASGQKEYRRKVIKH